METDFSAVYEAVAKALTSLQSSSTLPSTIIVRQLEQAPKPKKAPIAKILDSILRNQDAHDEYASRAFDRYRSSLINDDSNVDALREAAHLASADFLNSLFIETSQALTDVLQVALRAHVSSDEAFGVNELQPFLQAYTPELLSERGRVNLEPQDMSPIVEAIRRLSRFWRVFALARPDASWEGLRAMLLALCPKLLAAMCLRDQETARVCSEVLSEFVVQYEAFLPANFSEMAWNGIHLLLKSSAHVDLGLGVWLRWVDATSEEVAPAQEVLQTGAYWELLQSTLATGFSERRKYCLYILMNSLGCIRVSVDTRLLKFEPKQAKRLLEIWDRYSTLLEIISLSTSSNQLRDATPDLKLLLEPQSPIHPSWVVVLLALGFESGSGSTHKVVWELIIGLEEKYVGRLFGEVEGQKFIQTILLPFASQAIHFSMKSSQDVCEHGEAVSRFLKNILQQQSDSTARYTANAVLAHLDLRQDMVFAAARIYALKGILDGLENRTVFQEEDEMNLILRIARVHRFTKLKVDLCILIAAKLLLHVNIKEVGFENLLRTFTALFLNGRGYLLTDELLSTLGQHIDKYEAYACDDHYLKHLFGHDTESSCLQEHNAHDLLYLAVRIALAHQHPRPKLTFPRQFLERLSRGVFGIEFLSCAAWSPSLFLAVIEALGNPNIYLDVYDEYLSRCHAVENLPEFQARLAPLIQDIPIEAARKFLAGPDTRVAMVANWRITLERSLEDGVHGFTSKNHQWYDASREHADLVTIAAKSARLLLKYDKPYLPVTARDAVRMFRRTPIPKLGENKHENLKMSQCVGLSLRNSLQVVRACIETANGYEILMKEYRLKAKARKIKSGEWERPGEGIKETDLVVDAKEGEKKRRMRSEVANSVVAEVRLSTSGAGKEQVPISNNETSLQMNGLPKSKPKPAPKTASDWPLDQIVPIEFSDHEYHKHIPRHGPVSPNLTSKKRDDFSAWQESHAWDHEKNVSDGAPMDIQLPEGLALNKPLPKDVVHDFLDAVPRFMRFYDTQSFLELFGCIKVISKRALEHIGSYREFTKLLLLLWETVDDPTVRSDAADVYSGFVDMVIQPGILNIAVKDEALMGAIVTITNGVLEAGANKRSLKPRFSKVLRQAFLDAPSTVCALEWVVGLVFQLITKSNIPLESDLAMEYPLAVMWDRLQPGASYPREYIGDTETYAQIYIFDMLSRLDDSEPMQIAFARAVREEMFHPWTKNHPSMPLWVSWKNSAHLETLILLERFLDEEKATDFANVIITKVLMYEPHPRYRFMLEWILALALIRYPRNRNCIWPLTQDTDKPNPKLIASLLRVAVMVSRALEPSIREEFFTELVHTDISLTSNTKAVIRHQAIALVLELWSDAVTWEYTALTANPLFVRIHRAVINSEYFKRYSHQKDFRTFDATAGFSLAGIFNGSYLVGAEYVNLIDPSCFAALDEISETHHPPRKLPLFNNLSESATKLLASTEPAGKVDYAPKELANILAHAAAKQPTPLQTKAKSWDVSQLLDLTDEDGARTKQSAWLGRIEIILLASLVDNGFNLGGLSRVSEIMGASELVLRSKDITTSSEFRSTSTHSEGWLNISEVPVEGVVVWLREKKRMGYMIVGIEQTDRSVVLGKGWRFPKRCVLVLGREREGISADVLKEVDVCVEIEQRGITRSMNVQTAAAVVLYEIGRQIGEANDGKE